MKKELTDLITNIRESLSEQLDAETTCELMENILEDIQKSGDNKDANFLNKMLLLARESYIRGYIQGTVNAIEAAEN